MVSDCQIEPRKWWPKSRPGQQKTAMVWRFLFNCSPSQQFIAESWNDSEDALSVSLAFSLPCCYQVPGARGYPHEGPLAAYGSRWRFTTVQIVPAFKDQLDR